MRDIEQAQVALESKLRLPLHDRQRMAWRFNLREYGDAASRALLLEIIELVARVRLVSMRVEAPDGVTVRPEAKPGVHVLEVVWREARDDDVVAEVDMEGVLLKERHVRAHFDEEVFRVEVSSAVEHHASGAPSGRIDSLPRGNLAVSVDDSLLKDSSSSPPCAEGAGSGDHIAGAVYLECVTLCGGTTSSVEVILYVAKREKDGTFPSRGSLLDSGLDAEAAMQIVGESGGKVMKRRWYECCAGLILGVGIAIVDDDGLDIV